MAEDPAPSPARALLQNALGSFGQVVAAVAGAGIFLYLIGVGVFWQRLSAAQVQQQEVVAAIPRDQLAVLGAREALLSAFAGAAFAIFLYAYFRLWQRSQQTPPSHGVRGLLRDTLHHRPALHATVVLGFILPLWLPMDDLESALFLVLFLANVYFGFRSAHRSYLAKEFGTRARPWLRVGLGLSIAVFLVSVSRQSQFPDRFPIATVTLKTSTAVKEGMQVTDWASLKGQYLGSTTDSIILGQAPGVTSCGAADGDHATTCIIGRDSIKSISLSRGNPPPKPGHSLLHQLGLEIECLPPVCRVGGCTHTWLQAFVKDNRPPEVQRRKPCRSS